MQEIAEAIQIGAKAYLNRQYKTIAIVGVIVLVIISYFFSLLVGIGYFIGKNNPSAYKRIITIDAIIKALIALIFIKIIPHQFSYRTSDISVHELKQKFHQGKVLLT